MESTSKTNKSLYSIVSNKNLRSIPSSNLLLSNSTEGSIERLNSNRDSGLDRSTADSSFPSIETMPSHAKTMNLKKMSRSVENALRFVGKTVTEKNDEEVSILAANHIANMKKMSKNVGNALKFVGKTISENKETRLPINDSVSRRAYYFDPVEVERRRLDELKSTIQADTDRLLQEISPDSQIQSELRRILQEKATDHLSAQEALKKVLSGSSDDVRKRKVSVATSPMPMVPSSSFSPRPSSKFLHPQYDQGSLSVMQSRVRSNHSRQESKAFPPIDDDAIDSPYFEGTDREYVQGSNLLLSSRRRKEITNESSANSNQIVPSPYKTPSKNISQPAVQFPQSYSIPQYYPQIPSGYGLPFAQPFLPSAVTPSMFPYQHQYNNPNPYASSRYGYNPNLFNNPIPINYGFEQNPVGQFISPYPQIPVIYDHLYQSNSNTTAQLPDPQLSALEAENLKLLSQFNLINGKDASQVNQIKDTQTQSSPAVNITASTTNLGGQAAKVSDSDSIDKLKEEIKEKKKPKKKLSVLERKHQDELSTLSYQLEKLKKEQEIEALKQSMEQQKQRRISEQRHELWLLDQQHRLEMMQVKQLMDDGSIGEISNSLFDLATVTTQDMSIAASEADATEDDYTIFDKKIWSAAGVGLAPYRKLSPSSNSADDSFSLYIDGFLLDESSVFIEKGSSYRVAVGFYDNDSNQISKLTASGWQTLQTDDSSSSILQIHLLPKPIRRQITQIDGHSIKALIEFQCKSASSNESTISLGWTMSPMLTDTISLPARQNLLANKMSPIHVNQRFIHTGMWRIPLRDGIADPTIDTSSLESRSSHGFVLFRVVHNSLSRNANSWSALKSFGSNLNQIVRNYLEESNNTSDFSQSSNLSSLTNSVSPTPLSRERSVSSDTLLGRISSSSNLVHRQSFSLGSSSKLMSSPSRPQSTSEPSTTTASPRLLMPRTNSINGSNSNMMSAMAQAKRAFSIKKLPSRRNSLTKIQEEGSGNMDESEAPYSEEAASPELKAINRMISQAKFGSSSAISLPSKKELPWISGSVLSPCSMQYSPSSGDGVDILIDCCRFLPDNLFASRICVKVFYPSKQQYGNTCFSYAIPSSTASSPKFHSRFQVRSSSNSESLASSLMLVIRVDGIDVNGASGVVGYSCIRLFATRDREEVPPHSVEPFYVNTGAFQLPIHSGSPLGVGVFDDNMLQDLPRIPCSTILLRISHVPSAGSAYDPVSIHTANTNEGVADLPYSAGEYYSQPSEPTMLENMAYTVKQSLVHNNVSSLVASLPEGTGLPPKPLNPSEIPSYIESLFPAVDKMSSFIDYKMACPFTNGTGVQVSIDQVLNLPVIDPSSAKQTSAFNFFSSHAHPASIYMYKAIFSTTPPGLYYKNFALKEHRMNGVYHTRDIDCDRSTTNKTKYADTYELLQPQVTGKNAYLIVDIRAVKVESASSAPTSTRNKDNGNRSTFKVSIDEQRSYWTLMPLLVDQYGTHYVDSGVYQLPLIEGRVPCQGSNSTQSDELLFSADPFDELIQRIKISSANANPSVKLSDGASVIVRVVNPILKDLLTYHKALDSTPSTTLFTVPNAPTGTLASTSSVDMKYMNQIFEAVVEASNAKPGPGQRKASASSIITIDKLRNKFKHANKAFPPASSKDAASKMMVSDYLRKLGQVDEILAEVHRVFTNETGFSPAS